MRHTLFFLGLIFSGWLSAQVFDDVAFRAKTDEGLAAMYNMEHERAHAIFAELEKARPEHPAAYFLQATNRWWQTYLAVEMPTYYSYIEERTGLALAKNKALEETYPREYAFFAFMNHALVARLQSYRNNWMKAFNAARKTIGPVKDCISFVGTENEFYMVAGLYHYYVATYGDSYPVARPFLSFFPDGDKEKGLEEIEVASRLPSLGQYEAKFFLLYIYLDEIKRPEEGLAIGQQLHQRFPRNTWFQTEYARALVINKQYLAAERQLAELVQGYEAQAQHATEAIDSRKSRFTTHMMIKAYHVQGLLTLKRDRDYAAALTWFQKSLAMAALTGLEEDVVLAGSQYYMGVCYDNMSQREQAIAAYEDTLDMEENALYKDQAKQGLKTPVLVR